jgi:hypothetical protein
MRPAYSIISVILFLSVMATGNAHSQDWPHFWPARFDFLTGVAGDRSSIAVGDFDEDGRQDLAVANFGSHPLYESDVAVLLGTGVGSFSDPSFYRAGSGSQSIVVGDFDEDGHQDLAVANWEGDDVTILLGTGTGSFSDASFYGAGNAPYSVDVGDFDEDGHQDLVVASWIIRCGLVLWRR